MVRNKAQLVEAANAWLQVARKDIARQARAFMHNARINEATLANILDTNVPTIQRMLNADGDISLSLFAKMLIATNNVIIITPADARPPMGGMPMPGMPIPMDTPTPRRRPQPRQEEEATPMPARDARGRFIPRAQQQPVPHEDIDFPMPEDFFDDEEFEEDSALELAAQPTPEADVDEAPDADVDDATEARIARITAALRRNPELRSLLQDLVS